MGIGGSVNFNRDFTLYVCDMEIHTNNVRPKLKMLGHVSNHFHILISNTAYNLILRTGQSPISLDNRRSTVYIYMERDRERERKRELHTRSKNENNIGSKNWTRGVMLISTKAYRRTAC